MPSKTGIATESTSELQVDALPVPPYVGSGPECGGPEPETYEGHGRSRSKLRRHDRKTGCDCRKSGPAPSWKEYACGGGRMSPSDNPEGRYGHEHHRDRISHCFPDAGLS